MDLTPQLAVHISELPSLMHSGAFRISNNMAASSASSSGLVTPINELPPSMMGETNSANGDSQLPMDYFDFDLSSFGMDGGLAPTGINLQAIPEVDDDHRMAVNQSRTLETRRLSSSAGAGTIWADTVDHQNGNSVSDLAQTAMASRGEMLHEQVSLVLGCGIPRAEVPHTILSLITFPIRTDSLHTFICSHLPCSPNSTPINHDMVVRQSASRESQEMSTIWSMTGEQRIKQSRSVHMG